MAQLKLAGAQCKKRLLSCCPGLSVTKATVGCHSPGLECLQGPKTSPESLHLSLPRQAALKPHPRPDAGLEGDLADPSPAPVTPAQESLVGRRLQWSLSAPLTFLLCGRQPPRGSDTCECRGSRQHRGSKLWLGKETAGGE